MAASAAAVPISASCQRAGGRPRRRRAPSPAEHERERGQQQEPAGFGRAAAEQAHLLQVEHHAVGGDGREQHGARRTPAATGDQQPGAQSQRQRQATAPPGQVRHRPAQDVLVVARGVEQSPVAADGPLLPALPRLVEGLDQVVVPALGLGVRHEAAHEARLVHAARHGALALASLRGPAGLADQDVLAREDLRGLVVRVRHRGDRRVDVAGVVLPVRQQVDGDEVGARDDGRVLQPEIPHVAVAHGLLHRRLHALQVAEQLRRGALAPQQHLVADQHRADDVGIAVGERDEAGDLALGVGVVAADPRARDHLHAEARARPRGSAPCRARSRCARSPPAATAVRNRARAARGPR